MLLMKQLFTLISPQGPGAISHSGDWNKILLLHCSTRFISSEEQVTGTHVNTAAAKNAHCTDFQISM